MGMIVLIGLLLALVALDVMAWRWGVDSTDSAWRL